MIMIDVPKYARYTYNNYVKYYDLIVLQKLMYKFDLETSIHILLWRYNKFNVSKILKKILKSINLDDIDLFDKIIKSHIYKERHGKRRKLKPLKSKEYDEDRRSEYMRKRKQTLLERYGAENYVNLDKMRETNLKKYGVEIVSQNEKIKEKNKLKLKERNYDEVLKKRKETLLEKYGNENYFNMEKMKETNLKKYGVEFISQNKEIREKISKTLKQNYRCDFDKVRKTMVERYGVPYKGQMDIKNIDEYLNLTKEFLEEKFIKDDKFDIKSLQEYFNINESTAYKIKKKFDIKISTINTMQYYIFENIKTENKILNDRKVIKPFELDIVLPNIKLGIEYNGLMYHSEGSFNKGRIQNLDKNYHLYKLEICNLKGYDLFHIFESDNIDIWLSMINNRLGLNERIYARKCIIKELKSNEIKDFLNNNHLQGFVNSSINLGLYYNNELVSLMSFSKPRFNKKYDYELIRFCNKLNTSVIGSASKLFNYFIKNYNPKSIISYANRRFSNGSIYEKLGFKFLRKTEPNYFYFKVSESKTYSRNQFQKHKLVNLLDKFDENVSESENMFNNGYRRIYDCGNLVYEYIRSIKD